MKPYVWIVLFLWACALAALAVFVQGTDRVDRGT